MSLRHTILVMLESKEGTGYQLAKRFSGQYGYFWHASHQQIYQELSKLADLGWVEFSVEEQQGQLDKKIYRITEPGVNALKDWVRQPGPAHKVKDGFLVKLSAAHVVDANDLLEELYRYRREFQAELISFAEIDQQFQQLKGEKKKRYQFDYLVLKRGIDVYKGWLEWSEEVEQALLELRDCQQD